MGHSFFFCLLFWGHQIQAGVLQMNVQVPQKRGLAWMAPGATPARPPHTVHFAPPAEGLREELLSSRRDLVQKWMQRGPSWEPPGLLLPALIAEAVSGPPSGEDSYNSPSFLLCPQWFLKPHIHHSLVLLPPPPPPGPVSSHRWWVELGCSQPTPRS